MTDSRNKGARGEREVGKLLSEAGFPAHRGQQFSGGTESPDVVCPLLKENYHFEVKHVERLNMYKAMEQSQTDSNNTQMPLVVHKRNRKPWLVTTFFSNWLEKLRKEYSEIKLTFPTPKYKEGYDREQLESLFTDGFLEFLDKETNAQHYRMEGKTILVTSSAVLMAAIRYLFK